ncbi:hypothetical protein AQUCO_01200179v1 [Aquilegia coerulea]|uniref:Uncharacterized protein n=1 Tax=Aquilegia coerulea TaxID=218851 RepID=A0A2G5E4V2_AQUCA|nr:hypothetical protein AQUCO_01200179v1 [Aquilegia coerulea]
MLVQTLFISLLNHIDAGNGNNKHILLKQYLERWVLTWQEKNCKVYGVAELLVQIITLCGAGPSLSEQILAHPEYKHLVYLTDRVCYSVGLLHKPMVEKNGGITKGTPTLSIDSDMQELVQTVLLYSDNVVNSEIKQTFLAVVKSFIYATYCPQETMYNHIAQVLFKRVF